MVLRVKPLCIDLFCGLGGWTEGFLAEGYRVIGFDIEQRPYPGQLVLQDIRTLHGAQLRDAAIIVASSPCQEFSYRAMPWKRAKALGPPVDGINLFYQSIRIQHEAQEASGRQIPLVMENVRGAQKYVGDAKWKYKSFYLWGDVPALMPVPGKGFKGFKGFKKEWRDCEASRKWSSHSKERKEWSAQIAKIGNYILDSREGVRYH
jgi:hypothetical protein